MGRAERVVEKMRETSLLYLFFPSVLGHEYFPGKCPKYTPMEGFEWDKFSSGVWYVTQKYNTKSTCLTYEFGSDGSGIKTVKQDRRLPFSDKIDVDNTYRYKGKLVTPNEDNPADMLVTFPLNCGCGSGSPCACAGCKCCTNCDACKCCKRTQKNMSVIIILHGIMFNK